MRRVTRRSSRDASARAARASDSILAKASGADLGWAARTAGDVMSGAGAGSVVRVFIAFALSYRGAGRPVRWLVTITGESLGSSVASATNSNASSTEPTTAKKARTGIGAFRLHGPYAF